MSLTIIIATITITITIIITITINITVNITVNIYDYANSFTTSTSRQFLHPSAVYSFYRGLEMEAKKGD